MPVCRSHVKFPRTLTFPSLFVSLLVLSSSSAQAAEPCHASIRLDLEQRTYAHTAEDGTAWFTLEPPPAGWLLIEAQTVATAERRPILRLYDEECHRIMPHPGPTPLEGRWINELTSRAPAFVEVAARGSSRELWIDAWTASESNLVITLPRQAAFKNGEGKVEPDPIPDEPIDEWNELQVEPVQYLEIPAWGLLASTDLAVSWCPWALEPRLLGTLTCARTVRLNTSGKVQVERLSVGNPDWMRFELTKPASLSLIGDAESRFFDRYGHPMASKPTRGLSIDVAAGPVFLWLAPHDLGADSRVVEVLVQFE